MCLVRSANRSSQPHALRDPDGFTLEDTKPRSYSCTHSQSYICTNAIAHSKAHKVAPDSKTSAKSYSKAHKSTNVKSNSQSFFFSDFEALSKSN
jgi:hypothetical protein